MTRMKIAIIVIASIGATAVASAASPKPSGVYPLRHGIYVQAGTDCGSPPNAAIRQYDGRGIADAHSRNCRARILSREHGTYVVEQTCTDAGVGPAPRVTERQTVTVRDARSFAIRTRGPGTTYLYCPSRMLPGDLRGHVDQGATGTRSRLPNR